MSSSNDTALYNEFYGCSDHYRWHTPESLKYCLGDRLEKVPEDSIVYKIANLYWDGTSTGNADGPAAYELVGYKGNQGREIRRHQINDILVHMESIIADAQRGDRPPAHAIVIAKSRELEINHMMEEDDPRLYGPLCLRILDALGLSDKWHCALVLDASDPNVDIVADILAGEGIPVAYDVRGKRDSIIEPGSIKADDCGEPVYDGSLAPEYEMAIASASLLNALGAAALMWSPDAEDATLEAAFPDGVLHALSLGKERRSEKWLRSRASGRNTQVAKLACSYDISKLVGAKNCSNVAKCAIKTRDLTRLWMAYAGYPTVYGKTPAECAGFGYRGALNRGLKKGLDSAIAALYEGVPVEDILAAKGVQ